jgi:heme O synthase-like polyprenyltransferase
MRAESIASLGATGGAPPLLRSKRLGDYWALTKPDVNILIAITSFAGFCLARSGESRGG